MAQGEPTTNIKIVLLGDGGVGKTSILRRYCENTVKFARAATVGGDYSGADVVVGGVSYHVNIWDTSGQERYQCLVPVYCRDAQGAIIVYDTTSRGSFENLQKWIDLYRNSMEFGPVVIFGNKIDLEAKRAVDRQAGKEFCDAKAFEFMEGSAATGAQVQEAFERVVELASELGPLGIGRTVNLQDTSSAGSWWCC
jgi:small GTP-binding protein